MLTSTSLYRRSISIALLMAFLVAGLAGCSKQRANMTLNRAKKRLERAQNLNAERFQPAMLEDAQQKVSATENELSNEQFSQALESSKAALESSTQLLEQTRQEGANVLLSEAQQHLHVAKINKGDQINAELFQTIQTNVETAETLKNEEKYEESMELSRQVATDVEALLRDKREAALNEKRDAISKFDTLIRVEQGRQEAPAQVSSIEKKLEELDDLIESRDYISSHQVYLEILALVNEGITEARRNRSQKWIQTLDDKIQTAINEGAENYKPEMLSSVMSQFDKIVQDFRDEYYPRVLESAELLDNEVDQLILQTVWAAADDYLERVRTAIRKLENDKVQEYLPGRLEKIKETLQKAEEEYREDAFRETRRICQIALEDAGSLVKDFRAKAESEIQSAGGRLDEAQKILNTMQEIFEVDSPEVQNEVDNRFEETKKSLKAQLESNVQAATILLANARAQSEGEEFSSAIENARAVNRRANYIIHEIYHVVAHNNVMALSQRLSKLAGNGGTTYSPEQLEQARKSLEDARQEIRRVEEQTPEASNNNVPEVDADAYRKAVQMTSEARAQSEVLVMSIQSDVRALIQKAEDMVSVADDNQAQTHATGDLTTARQVVLQAREQLENNNYADAGSSAQQAYEIATNAATKSVRSWASQELASAQSAIDEAEQAKADVHAPQRAEKAVNRKQAAEEIFSRADTLQGPMEVINAYQQSRDMAIQARRDAVGAQMEPITQANEQITTAKRFGAWEYDHPTVLSAILNAKMALKAMEDDNYDQAHAYAQQAQQLAESVSAETKEYRYARRVEQARQDLQNQMEAGSRYFTVDEIRKLAVQLQLIKRDYSVERFETISAALDQYENELYEIGRETPTVFQEMVENQRDIYDSLIDRRARYFAGPEMTRAEKNLRWAVIDFNKGEYRSAYTNLKNASETLAEVEQVFQEQIFAQNVRDLLEEYDDAMIDIRLLLHTSPGGFQWIYGKIESPRYNRAILRGSNPTKFRKSMAFLLKQMKSLDYPKSAERLYDQSVECFELGHTSAVEFEKFQILDHYDIDSAQKIIKNAYQTMRKSRDVREELMDEFEIEGLQVPMLTEQQLQMSNN